MYTEVLSSQACSVFNVIEKDMYIVYHWTFIC